MDRHLLQGSMPGIVSLVNIRKDDRKWSCYLEVLIKVFDSLPFDFNALQSLALHL